MSDRESYETANAGEPRRKSACGQDCPHCQGGTCYLETGHITQHHCGSCGNTWETLHHLANG